MMVGLSNTKLTTSMLAYCHPSPTMRMTTMLAYCSHDDYPSPTFVAVDSCDVSQLMDLEAYYLELPRAGCG
jgi:hypothetical protein